MEREVTEYAKCRVVGESGSVELDLVSNWGEEKGVPQNPCATL